MKKMPRGHTRLRQEVLTLRVMLVEQGKWDLVKQLDAFWQPATQPTAVQPGGYIDCVIHTNSHNQKSQAI